MPTGLITNQLKQLKMEQKYFKAFMKAAIG